MKTSSTLRYLFTILRIVIGWHFLYEGIAKIFTPNWSSASYLLSATGPFKSFFIGMASNHFLVYLTDYAIIFGLIGLGAALFVGVATRLSAILGAFLLFLFYIASPPFSPNPVGYGVEGHYLIINKNLIELIILIVIACLPADWFYALENFRTSSPEKNPENLRAVPEKANHYLNTGALDRRNMIKNLMAIPVLGGFIYSVVRNHGWASHEERHLRSQLGAIDGSSGASIKVVKKIDLSQLIKPIPSGKIKDVDIGRLICGGNLISGYAHSRDLIYVSDFLKNYFTTEKVIETFRLCEACGINTTAVGTDELCRSILDKYWKTGGKIKWIAPVYPDERDYKAIIDLAVDSGATGVMLIGNLGDLWAREGKFELINNVVEHIKSKKVLAGVAGHELMTFRGIEENGIDADFYMKTLHNTSYWSWRDNEPKEKMVIDNYAIDNYWARNPQETIEFMEKLNKPWIAFKVLAAGAVQPKEGFKYVFENGADFACVGMFDFQVVEDANILNEVLDNRDFSRRRTWMA